MGLLLCGDSMPLKRQTSGSEWLGEVAALAAINFAAGKLALLLAIPPGYATAIWPPSGIALAALLLFGARLWPGVWIGSFLINLTASLDPTSASSIARSVAIAGGIGAGSTLQAFAGVYLVRRLAGFPNPLDNGRSVHRFLLIGG